MSLLVKFNLILILCFGIALVPAHLITRDLLQKNARTQVVQHARLMMQTALATRGYTNKQIKPLLAVAPGRGVPAADGPGVLRDGDLQHAAGDVPGVHVQGSDAQSDQPARPHRGLGGGRRQRVPRRTRKLPEIIGERDAPLGRALYLARPITITDPGCLSCHTTPEMTPASVVKRYGTSGGYGWKLNEIIGAQIVSVPMAVPLDHGDAGAPRDARVARGRLRVHPRPLERHAVVHDHPSDPPALADGRRGLDGQPRRARGPIPAAGTRWACSRDPSIACASAS